MANLPDPYNWILPIGTVVVTGLGMMGLTVAKRDDLADALRSAGILKTPEPAVGDRSSVPSHTSTRAPSSTGE